MCKKSVCGTCSKNTWWGCGQHIPSVMDPVPEAERCTCEPKKEVNGAKYPPMGPAFSFGMVKDMLGFGNKQGGGGDGKGEL